MDSFTPTNWNDNLMHDMSGSASPVVFNFAGKTLVAFRLARRLAGVRGGRSDDSEPQQQQQER